MTKLPHACARFERDGAVLVLDPGGFSDPPAALQGADAVLITHEHPDHFAAEALQAAGVPVFAHPEVLAKVPGVPGTPLEPGDTAEAAGFQIRVFGGRHAHIHEDVPDLPNNAYLIGDRVYYPGDSFSLADAPVDVLLVPVGGPWMKIAEAIDFVRAVRPNRAHPTHDAVLSAAGQQFADNWMAQRGGAGYSRLEIGTPVEL
jgi:L-ascorbate metabolism protein UlaG (beta-lactamase superfamily)